MKHHQWKQDGGAAPLQSQYCNKNLERQKWHEIFTNEKKN